LGSFKSCAWALVMKRPLIAANSIRNIAASSPVSEPDRRLDAPQEDLLLPLVEDNERIESATGSMASRLPPFLGLFAASAGSAPREPPWPGRTTSVAPRPGAGDQAGSQAASVAR
jgi:hypothetical protein